MARADLSADCSRCAGLCCVVPAFSASADFAIDKPGGTACPNLLADSRCGIHDRLREEGFPGCTAYDCFGAGQRVVQVTFAGRDRRIDREAAAGMAVVFPVMRDLHELLWLLTEALALPVAAGHAGMHEEGYDEVAAALADLERLASGDPADVAALDVDALRRRVNPLLLRASAAARADREGPDLRGADLLGRDLRGTSLVGASLRGALLVGADLRGTDLALADLTGADLRGADVRGADLAGALFLSQAQVAGARGDRTTSLPAALERPGHWLRP